MNVNKYFHQTRNKAHKADVPVFNLVRGGCERSRPKHHPSPFVTSSGLPTELALQNAIVSPFVRRPIIPSAFGEVRSFSFATSDPPESTRDLISRYSIPSTSTALNFEGIFKENFTFSSSSPQRNEHVFKTPAVPKKYSKHRTPDSKSKTTSASSTFFTPSGRTPRTTKSSTTTASASENHTVVAIAEGRGNARGEVGIAAVDLKRPHLILCQISDTQTYVNTLRKINVLNPFQILVPTTFCDKANNKLYQLMLDSFPRANFVTVQRKFFNETQGMESVKQLCLPEYSSVQLIVLRKSYALAAAAALIKYAEFEQNIQFSQKSVRVDYQGGDNIVLIDLDTTQKLELVTSQNIGNASTDKTLYGVLNNCNTVGGQRRLRSTILQPSTEAKLINERLDCVTELIENPKLFFSLKAVLPKFADVEQLLYLCTQIPNKDNVKGAEIQINYALLLKTSLEAIPALRDALKDSRTEFFRIFSECLENPHYQLMLDQIGNILNEDSHLSKSFCMSQFQRCFAIKSGLNGFLDIARVTYFELVEDFNEIVENLINEYRLPLIIRTLKNTGPALQLKLNEDRRNFNIKDLPSVFIQVQRSRSVITMTTKELLFLKERMNHFIHEIQLLSCSIVFDMLQDIRPYIGCLYKFCEHLAELDMIVSFAQCSKHFSFVRPVFSNSTNLKNAVHPILNHISNSKPVANDVFGSIDQNVCLITGPNMGGKSVYIRQVALLQIMAQIGCYVPAEVAEFRLTDRIFARISFNDSIECSASSFILEIKEMQYIMNSVTSNSLIIVDELCRGTSTEEGTCMAWSICEKLLESSAFIFFTTHFMYLTQLQDLYCNVVNYHFEAIEITSEDSPLIRLVYTHRLVKGVLKLEQYGLKLARSTALPDSVLEMSEKTAKILSAQWKVTDTANCDENEDKKVENVIQILLQMVDNGTISIPGIQEVAEFVKSTIQFVPSICFEVGVNNTGHRIETIMRTPSPRPIAAGETRTPYLKEINDTESAWENDEVRQSDTMLYFEEDDNFEEPEERPCSGIAFGEESSEMEDEDCSQYGTISDIGGSQQSVMTFGDASNEGFRYEDGVQSSQSDRYSELSEPQIGSDSSYVRTGTSDSGSGYHVPVNIFMSKQSKTFNINPDYNEPGFWTMNETTSRVMFSVQGKKKGKSSNFEMKRNYKF